MNKTITLDMKFITKFSKFIYFEKIIQNESLSEDEIEKILNYLYDENWDALTYVRDLSEEFIERHSDKLNWYSISMFKKLNEDFIRKFSDKVKWEYISSRQTLSEDFIRKFSDKVDFSVILDIYNLSEEFIDDFKDKLDWDIITRKNDFIK